jgi:nucleotide-binding universal stress UspA family protein
MKKIVVPIDGSEHSKMAIEKAKELATAFGSSVVLLHVNEFTRYSASLATGAAILERDRKLFDEKSESLVEEAKKAFDGTGISVEAVMLKGSAADKIVEYLDANDCDLVVMGSHGMSGLRRFTIGSITHKVMVQINNPLLIVR